MEEDRHICPYCGAESPRKCAFSDIAPDYDKELFGEIEQDDSCPWVESGEFAEEVLGQ